MKKLLQLLVLLCLTVPTQAQSAYQEIRDGNVEFKNNAFEKATEKYQQSIAKDIEPVESSYNLGNALYRQEKYEDAARYFNQAANKTEDKAIKSNAYHNLGNSYLKEEKFEEGVKAYKSALRNNPQNEDSRYNLAYAQKMLQQQQQQEQEQKDDEKKEDQENKDDQEKKDDEKKEDQEKKDEEQKDQDEKGDEEKSEEEKKQEKEKQQQQKEQQVSREDAERILEALQQKEKDLQEKLKKKKIKGVKVNIEKDW